MALTEFKFTAPTTNSDGSAINPATEPLTYNILLDTANPPVKSYAVPAAETVADASGVITVTFKQLGFTPVNLTTYFAEVTATSAGGTSVPTPILQFTYTVTPSAPTGFTVS